LQVVVAVEMLLRALVVYLVAQVEEILLKVQAALAL
jgi:hypothetical protein